MDDYEAEERRKIIAASGSGGSAQYRALETAGTMKFGESTFGDTTTLRDDEGNVLVALDCGKDECIGSHIWVGYSGDRHYCTGPEA